MTNTAQYATTQLVEVRGFLQSGAGLLGELSGLRSDPADAFPLGVVNVPEIIQSPGLPDLPAHTPDLSYLQKKTETKSGQLCNYPLKNTLMPDLDTCGRLSYS